MTNVLNVMKQLLIVYRVNMIQILNKEYVQNVIHHMHGIQLQMNVIYVKIIIIMTVNQKHVNKI